MTLWDLLGRFLPRRAGGSEWERLAAPLGVGAERLPHRIEGRSLVPVCEYRRYRKRKKGGGHRDISEPDAKLKAIQQQILSRYLATRSPHSAATAYTSGRSTADHVWTHAGAELILTVDLADFFPSTRADRVEDWWCEVLGNFEQARLMTIMTTDRDGLPQGAPTSPALSNLVNYELDTRLTARADLVGARYTRYCDDLAFSWPRGAEPPSDFRAGVTTTLLEFGYRPHPTKGWCLFDRRDEPEVTGVILGRNGRVRLPERLTRVMAKLARSDDPHDGQRLAGYRAYAKMMTRRRKILPPVRAPQARAYTPPSEDEIPF